jgi:hypothetical protein
MSVYKPMSQSNQREDYDKVRGQDTVAQDNWQPKLIIILKDDLNAMSKTDSRLSIFRDLGIA